MNWPPPVVRWEPPHSCGGGALQRSEKASPSRMRFSAGPFGASPSSSSISELSNPINRFPHAARNPVQSNRGLQRPPKPSEEFVNLSRVEMTPVLCFVRLTDISIRPHVSVRNAHFATVFAASARLLARHDASQNKQKTLRKTKPIQSRPAVGARPCRDEGRVAAPAPNNPRRNARHCRRVDQSHG